MEVEERAESTLHAVQCLQSCSALTEINDTHMGVGHCPEIGSDVYPDLIVIDHVFSGPAHNVSAGRTGTVVGGTRSDGLSISW
jgi:hypothetical protein